MDYTTAGYVGAASVAGLYVARAFRGGARAPLSWTQLGMVAGTSAASAVVAPTISASLVCPHSPGAPLVESAASAGVAYGIMYALGDRTGATMFVPVQIGAYLAGTWVSRWMRQRAATAAAQAEPLQDVNSFPAMG
jgi:hypothetical protein